jgi:hypothetical protein
MRSFVRWIKDNFYAASFTVIFVTCSVVVGTQITIYREVEKQGDAAEDRREILDYLDCVVGSLLLIDIEERSTKELVNNCDISHRRVENIERIQQNTEHDIEDTE